MRRPARRTRATTERSLASYRDEFPILSRKTYLISASLGPISSRARANLDRYLDAWASKGAPDHVWFEDIFPAMGRLKGTFARLAGCDPDELAITTNVSVAISTIASALDFRERNKVVMSELDFPTDGHVWLAQARRGVEIDWLRSPDGLTIPLEEYDRAIDERTAVVMVNRVLYRSSAIVDAKEICRIAHERGALSFLDDYHGIGIVPLDLHDLGADVYAAGVLKWLCGGPGLAFLYVRRHLISKLEPTVTGWFGTAEPFAFDTEHLSYHPTARRFEHGTPPAPAYFLAQGGLDVIAEVTPERIRARQGELTDHVIARADEMGLPVRTPQERGARGGVVNVGVGPEAGKICHALLERDVCTDYRGDGLRISPHFFNTEDDVDRCFDELATLL
ncbi:MAG TPA: aminotransferase class V-fold PLP-dependent enzyme [Actinomycetota bacterium]|nr:aminotransferase class V-fold PLP-dependent enzyme [Actinomycetota bacterium]